MGTCRTLAGPTLRVTVTLLLLAANAPLCITSLATQLTPALRVSMEARLFPYRYDHSHLHSPRAAQDEADPNCSALCWGALPLRWRTPSPLPGVVEPVGDRRSYHDSQLAANL